MKQITLKELKKICGCESNNDFANMLSIYMDSASDDANTRGHNEYGKLLRIRSNKIYTELQKLGYYEGV